MCKCGEGLAERIQNPSSGGDIKELFNVGVLEMGRPIIIITLINTKVNRTMNNNFASETESSQFERLEDMPPLSSFRNALQAGLDPEQVNQLIQKFAGVFKNGREQNLEEGLRIVAELLGKGYAPEVAKCPEIANTMMRQFSGLCREMEKEPKAQIRMMHVLSTLAELIKQCPQVKIAFTRRFLQSVFLIDEELLECSPYRKQILAVLGVIYESTSRQAKLLKKLDLVREFKAAVLSNYHIVEESFSARLFNKSLYNLAVQGESLTEAELHKYGVFESIARFMGAQNSQALIQKLKSALGRLNAPQVKNIVRCDC